MKRDTANGCRFRAGDPKGHYESYFQRANHPTKPLAFWIRYTIFVPKGQPDRAVGEQWAMFFDGENGVNTAIKSVHPMSECRFSEESLSAGIADSTLDQTSLAGTTEGDGNKLVWNLTYTTPEPPLLLLARKYYDIGFPKAKALVGAPNAVYQGTITVNDREISVEGWPGSQNHNWGIQHTDRYAWGQVAGFDNDPNAFLECSTAQIKLGPLWSPRFTLVVLRLDGEEYRLNGLWRGMMAKGAYDLFHWEFQTQQDGVKIRGKIEANGDRFVALPYDNPPGGTKSCLNSKLATCELTVERPGHPEKTLHSAHRAAFEILTDRTDRFRTSEVIRGALFQKLGKELPYCCEVRVGRFDESRRYLDEEDRSDGKGKGKGKRKSVIRIEATVLVEGDSQRASWSAREVGRSRTWARTLGRSSRS